jgi:hypothetical protein
MFQIIKRAYSIFLLILILSVGIYFVIDIQKQHYENTDVYCNELYGEDNWTFIPAKSKSIGQRWECVCLDVSSNTLNDEIK